MPTTRNNPTPTGNPDNNDVTYDEVTDNGDEGNEMKLLLERLNSLVEDNKRREDRHESMLNNLVNTFEKKFELYIDQLKAENFLIKKDNDAIKEDVTKLKDDNKILQSANIKLTNEVNKCQSKLDDIVQTSLNDKINIVTNDKSIGNSLSIINKICSTSDIKATDMEIINETNTDKGNKKLLIRLSGTMTKKKILQSKTRLREANIVPFEILTKRRQDILDEARKACNTGIISSAFTINGNVLIKFNRADRNSVRIDSLSHLLEVTKVKN